MKITSSRSINRIIRELKGSRTKRTKTPEAAEEEISRLIELQREAAQAAIEGSAIKPFGALKGLDAASKVEEEYKVAKTGVRSRFGGIAKALGMSEQESKALDQLFGKKVPEDELKKLREKFKIKTPEQKAQEQAQVKAAKEQAKAEKVERAQKRQQQLDRIEELSNKIFDLATSLQKTIQGIANKTGAEDVKDIDFRKGGYFDAAGKRLKKADVEKGSGVTYSRKTKRFKDVKTGKFVSEKVARQRMNITKAGSRAAAGAGIAKMIPGVGPAIAAGATLAAGTGLASKVLSKEAAVTDDTGEKLDKLSGDTKEIKAGITKLLDPGSSFIEKIVARIGAAFGAAFPLLKATVEWAWGLAKSGYKWVKNVATTIGDWLKQTLIKIKFTFPGVKAFGRTLWKPIVIKPFSFLKSSKGPEPGAPPVEQAAPPPPAPPGGTEAGAAPAGGVPTDIPPAPAPPPPAPAPAAASGGETATRGGSSMSGGGPPRRLGAAAAGRGKVDPSAAKNAALAAAAKFGITGPHLAQFMAQLEHESGGFKHVEENLRYSAKRLMEVFPKYYKDPAVAQAEEYQPILIANRVYGGRMGNGPPESGDGYKYRGRGLIQLTGKDNYSRFGKMAGVDLTSNPDMAGNLGTAAEIAAAFYKKNVMDKGVDGNDTKKVTKIINGGSHGLSHREQLFASYSKDPSSLQATGPAPEGGAMLASAQEPPPAATTDVRIGGEAGGGTGAAAAPSTGGSAAAVTPPMLASAPTATQIAPTPVSGAMVGAETTAVSSARDQMVASAAAPAVIPIPTPTGSSPAQQKPSGTSVRATSRDSESSFARALAKDFAHPSTFTTIGTV